MVDMICELLGVSWDAAAWYAPHVMTAAVVIIAAMCITICLMILVILRRLTRINRRG